MRTLEELMASHEGRSLLEMRGVATDEEAFVGSLRPPRLHELSEHLGTPSGAPIVYTAHQVMIDYPESVIAKFRAVQRVGGRPEVAAAVLWLDLDRAGADRMAVGTVVHGRGGGLQIRLASRRHDHKEVRFVALEQAQVAQTVRKIDAWARQHTAAAGRAARVAQVLLGGGSGTLGRTNLALSSLLLHEQLGMTVPSALISDLADRGILTQAVNDVVDAVEDVVTVFNAAVGSLVAADVDPQVHYLPADYLPLHYSCDRDDRRCTLSRRRAGADTFAVTTCLCGATYRFHLGSRSMSIDELAATGRWSTDVTLPLYLNNLASGVVVGRSSALYGMVLNEVLEKVLGWVPIPMLVPVDLPAVLARGAEGESLLQRYMVAP